MRISMLFFLFLGILSLDASAQTFQKRTVSSGYAGKMCHLRAYFKVKTSSSKCWHAELSVQTHNKNIKSVAFYIDNKLVGKDNTYPFQWKGSQVKPGNRKFKAVIESTDCNYLNWQSRTAYVWPCVN